MTDLQKMGKQTRATGMIFKTFKALQKLDISITGELAYWINHKM